MSSHKKKMVKVKVRFPQKRMKTMMQKDESVGKLSASVPAMMSRALELFLGELAERSAQVGKRHNNQELSGQHVKRAVRDHEDLVFLEEHVKGYEALGEVAAVADDFDEEEEDVMDLLHAVEMREIKQDPEERRKKKKKKKRRRIESSDSD